MSVPFKFSLFNQSKKNVESSLLPLSIVAKFVSVLSEHKYSFGIPAAAVFPGSGVAGVKCRLLLFELKRVIEDMKNSMGALNRSDTIGWDTGREELLCLVVSCL